MAGAAETVNVTPPDAQNEPISSGLEGELHVLEDTTLEALGAMVSDLAITSGLETAVVPETTADAIATEPTPTEHMMPTTASYTMPEGPEHV